MEDWPKAAFPTDEIIQEEPTVAKAQRDELRDIQVNLTRMAEKRGEMRAAKKMYEEAAAAMEIYKKEAHDGIDKYWIKKVKPNE